MNFILPPSDLTSRDIAMFSDIQNLWGDAAYVNFQNRLRPHKLLSSLVLRVFAAGIKTGPTRFMCIAIVIFLHPHLRAFSRGADVLFYGPSKNNDRILQRVSTLLQDAPLRQYHASERAPLSTRLSAALRFGKLRALTRALSPYNGSGTFLATQLILTAAARLYFETSLTGARAQVVILANDHSPMQVGLRDAAYACNLRCVYCQHAPISPLYPRLKFDLSILSDQASLATYQKRGPITGETVFLSPFRSKPTPFTPVHQIVTVGMCLSRVPARDKVINRLKELCSHSTVIKIMLRGHPQDSAKLKDFAAIDPRITVTCPNSDIVSFAQACDLVVVSGSGVLIELLHSGVACVYAGDLDQLGHDPHNFVASGLVPDFSHQSLVTLTAEITAFFDVSWRRAFSNFDATATAAPSTLKQSTRAAVIKLLNLSDPNQ